MSLLSRYRAYKPLTKLSVWGGLASIVGLPLGIGLWLLGGLHSQPSLTVTNSPGTIQVGRDLTISTPQIVVAQAVEQRTRRQRISPALAGDMNKALSSAIGCAIQIQSVADAEAGELADGLVLAFLDAGWAVASGTVTAKPFRGLLVAGRGTVPTRCGDAHDRGLQLLKDAGITSVAVDLNAYTGYLMASVEAARYDRRTYSPGPTPCTSQECQSVLWVGQRN